jgi:hypothetical protein
MKKIAFIITFWLALCRLALAQTDTSFYRPFPTGYAVWEYAQGQVEVTRSYYYFVYSAYCQYGDTVVNELLYHKIYHLGGRTSHYLEVQPHIEHIDTASLKKQEVYALIREDSNRKVYWIDIRAIRSNPAVYRERLLYDFQSAEKGDTFSIICYEPSLYLNYSSSNHCYSDTVNSKKRDRFTPVYGQDNRLISNRKSYKMNGYGDCETDRFGVGRPGITWIEGIGTTYSRLFESMGRTSSSREGPAFLLSYIQNNQRCRISGNLETGTDLSCGCYPVSRPSELFSNSQAIPVTVHPNPIASGQLLSIHAPANTTAHGPFRLQLFNLHRQLVAVSSVADLNAGIPIQLAPGFYTGQIIGASPQIPLTFKLMVE